MRLVPSAALAALCAVALAGPAHALTGAQRAPVDEFSDATARVFLGHGGSCTGALVHPEWVLTARHCLEQNFVPRIGFGTSGHDSMSRPREIRHNAADDITLIRLEQPVSMTPLEVSLDAEDAGPGDVAEIYGWGIDAEGLDYLTYGKRRVQVHGGDYDPRDPSNIPIDSGRTYSDDYGTARTTPGDSGSPVLVDGKVVSIHIRSWNAPEEDNFYSASVTLARHADWLLEIVPDLLDGPVAAGDAEGADADGLERGEPSGGTPGTGSIDLSAIVGGSVEGSVASSRG